MTLRFGVRRQTVTCEADTEIREAACQSVPFVRVPGRSASWVTEQLSEIFGCFGHGGFFYFSSPPSRPPNLCSNLWRMFATTRMVHVVEDLRESCHASDVRDGQLRD